MGQKQPKQLPPPLPQKTLKQMVKEMNKCIMRQRRTFQRQLYKLQSTDKKLRSDLQRMTKNRDPISSRRIIANNILRNQRFTQRYQHLDVQLQSMQFQLSTTATTQTLVNVMRNMAHLMGKSNQSNNVLSIQQAMTMFQVETEKGNLMTEMVEDAMNMGEDVVEDEDAERLVREMEGREVAARQGGVRKVQLPNELEEFQARMQRLG